MSEETWGELADDTPITPTAPSDTTNGPMQRTFEECFNDLVQSTRNAVAKLDSMPEAELDPSSIRYRESLRAILKNYDAKKP